MVVILVRKNKKQSGKTRDPHPSNTRPGGIRWGMLFLFGALVVLGFSVVWALLDSDNEGTGIEFTSIDFGGSEEEAAVSAGIYGLLYEASSQRPSPRPDLSSIFMPSVQYWKNDIIDWAADYDLDPNLAATVMQIESCGFSEAGSGAGAMGLFQVMPFHFEADEQPYDPDTNALHGLAYLSLGLEKSGGHAGLALAGYNGGHGVIYRNYESWAYETKRYYRWGSGIYREASAGWLSSPSLLAWLAAGGQSLCDEAEVHLGLE